MDLPTNLIESVPARKTLETGVSSKFSHPLWATFFLFLYSTVVILSPVIYIVFAFFLVSIFGTNPKADNLIIYFIALIVSMIFSIIFIGVSYIYLTELFKKFLLFFVVLPIIIFGVATYKIGYEVKNEVHLNALYRIEKDAFSKQALSVFESIKTTLPWISYSSCSSTYCFQPILLYVNKTELTNEDLSTLEALLSQIIPIKGSVKDIEGNSKGYFFKKIDGVPLMNISLIPDPWVCNNKERILYTCEILNKVSCVREIESCK